MSLLGFLNSLVVVVAGFFIAFAIAAHVFFPNGTSGDGKGDRDGEVAEDAARKAREKEVEATAASRVALHPEMQLPPAVLIRRRWNMPACVAKEMGESRRR